MDMAAKIITYSMPEPNTGCWLWIGKTVDCDGYDRGFVGIGNRKMRSASRVSYECFVGPIPDGLHILHSCDMPLCVNPDHLSAGTHTQNMADMVRRNRRGPKHKYVRLTNAQRSEIVRIAPAHSISELARQFNITRSGIRAVLKAA